MSRKAGSVGTTQHMSGQVFNAKVGIVFGVPTTFKSDARKVVNTLTGAISKLDERESIVMKVRGEEGFNFEILDAMSFEQLGVATGKQLTKDDLKLLRGAEILYYVSDRVKGKPYYYRPEQPVDSSELAQRSGEFTSLFGIAPKDQDAFDELPDYVGHAKFDDDDAAAITAKAEELKARLLAEDEAAKAAPTPEPNGAPKSKK